ncbi:Mu transposase domain-containing protein [Mycobacterium sp.]|uniref:Mu transposase domain-containing protein n=1 Tax=Mycobacterium sp. TaxID=1785 RepID=UPI003A86766E
MTATETQVRILMQERKSGKTQEQAAAKANLRSRKTVARYEKLEQFPSELKQPRTYQTREDAFASVWPQIEQMLAMTPELEAKALFEWLCDEKPGQYRESQLRTFQRRVERWRGLNQGQVASLDQVRVPGESIQVDGTWMSELAVTIQGEPFKHIFIHCVLPYSNWEWGRVAQSESLVAVRLALQSSLRKVGYVPQIVQTDNSSAATRRLGINEEDEAGKSRGYTSGYLALLSHYGLQPQSTHVSSPNENGDVESQNGALKRAVNQYLLLRGSRDFADIAAYETFLFEVMEKRNRGRQERLAEELALMKAVTATPLATSIEKKVRVSRGSLIQLQRKSYSVPTSLIGKEVTVRIQEWTIDIYYAGKWVERLPRLIGAERHHVNYRHVIDSLLRKPGGFRRYRFRDDLFPRLIFRRAWEQLQEWHTPRQADIISLQILKLAARTLEDDVAAVLSTLVASGEQWNKEDVDSLLAPAPVVVPQLESGSVDLSRYDRLLEGVSHELA